MSTNRVLSREDGNLNSTSSIVTTRVKPFRDIDLTFTVSETGELYVKRDASAVKQAVKNLIQTNYFEKPFLPFASKDKFTEAYTNFYKSMLS